MEEKMAHLSKRGLTKELIRSPAAIAKSRRLNGQNISNFLARGQARHC
jgi:hypothetical protein